MTSRILGIAREKTFSPGRERDDLEILRQTGKHLIALWYLVDILDPEELEGKAREVSVVFSMAQGRETLEILKGWEKRGCLIVNSPQSALNCYRAEMAGIFKSSSLPFPRTAILDLQDYITVPEEFEIEKGVWIKRGDVHAIERDDVVWINERKKLPILLKSYRERGISIALIQEDLKGDVVKFYALQGEGLLEWRYTKAPGSYPFDVKQLESLAEKAADLLGLDVYGGDTIVTKEGELYLIDLNDWPSFSSCRELASEKIAQLILKRMGGRRNNA
ncbi:MAG: hypothetical protein HY731_00420 [Candidatus Tectomicrobia bacterium]|nr:hypothetical protein [Candidatus Tectomicrobia bacterium]